MKKSYVLPLLSFALFVTAACGDDPAAGERREERHAVFDGTDMPASLPWSGGMYEVRVRFEALTRDVSDERPWSVRIVVGGVAGEAVRCDEGTAAAVWVEENLTEAARTVAVELYADGAQWIEVARAQQEAGLIEVAGTWWARGNLALEMPVNGKQVHRFVVAPSPGEPGLYFNRLSCYGVRSDESSYSGVAYTPEPVPTPLADLPEGDGDPCRLIGDGGLRTPTFGELYALFGLRDAEPTTVGGMTGLGFDGRRLFLPFAGACDRESGAVGYRQTHGGYRGLGVDPDGRGVLLFMSAEYAGLDYDAGLSMASVRCVKNTRPPAYVSHTPESAPSGAAVRLTVVTDPGDAQCYPVWLRASTGGDIEAEATARQPTVCFDIPANGQPEELVYRILIDGSDTGREFVQPGLEGYALYISHTPSEAGYEAFSLTVRCRSDLPSFPVRITDGEVLDETVHATSAEPVATFGVPENRSDTRRVISIFVNGADTGAKVVQEASPVQQDKLSVVWSPGYLTVKTGAFGFAGEQERGLYFKYGSRYGMTIDTDRPASGSSYAGTAYTPEPVQVAYEGIPAEEVDPCSLVAPAGTWRTPTATEWDELLDCGYEFEAGTFRCYTDGEQRVYLTPSGSLKEGGVGILGSSFVRTWSSTPKTEDTWFTLSGGLSSASSVFGTTVGAKAETAMMVRCVRAR